MHSFCPYMYFYPLSKNTDFEQIFLKNLYYIFNLNFLMTFPILYKPTIFRSSSMSPGKRVVKTATPPATKFARFGCPFLNPL